jgi:hypothetical protein
MRITAIVISLLIMTSAAFAGPIIDVQTGVYAEGDQVVVSGAVVTGVRSNGFFMSEDPNALYAGVWVYTGSGNHTAVEGDLVDVAGIYVEYYDLTEIDVSADPEGYATVVGQFSGTLMPLDVTIATLAADAEPYEGCFIRVTDGMTVTEAPNNYGEWVAESIETPGATLRFDDYWYDDTTVMLGDCYNSVTGCLYYGYGNFLMEAHADGIELTDCVVASEPVSFDSIKSLYR